jgi:hypothetical protein
LAKLTGKPDWVVTSASCVPSLMRRQCRRINRNSH